MSRLSLTPETVCYCSGVRIVTSLLVACAAIALALACVTFDPLASGFSVDDRNDDATLSLDFSVVLPETQLEPLLVPSISGPVFFDHRPPISRLITAEVFRPPRVRA